VTESGMVRSKTDNFVYDFADGAAGVARVLFEFRERVSSHATWHSGRDRSSQARPWPEGFRPSRTAESAVSGVAFDLFNHFNLGTPTLARPALISSKTRRQSANL
jgi:hypothetical protein